MTGLTTYIVLFGKGKLIKIKVFRPVKFFSIRMPILWIFYVVFFLVNILATCEITL